MHVATNNGCLSVLQAMHVATNNGCLSVLQAMHVVKLVSALAVFEVMGVETLLPVLSDLSDLLGPSDEDASAACARRFTKSRSS